jgi:hypothetical protein
MQGDTKISADCDLEECGNWSWQRQDPWKYIDASSPHRKFNQVLRPESQDGRRLIRKWRMHTQECGINSHLVITLKRTYLDTGQSSGDEGKDPDSEDDVPGYGRNGQKRTQVSASLSRWHR